MIIKTDSDRSLLEDAAEILKSIMDCTLNVCLVGSTTLDLDEYVTDLIEHFGVVSAPKKFYDWPSSACISINEEIAHGIASKRVIQKEDLIKLDISIWHKGNMCVDMCRTVYHGDDPEKQHLVDVAKQCVLEVVSQVKSGDSVLKIGKIIDDLATDQGVFVEPRLQGHGIGRHLHESPKVPHHFDISQLSDSEILMDGQLICVEPILLASPTNIYTRGLVYVSGTGAPSAQYEDTLLVTEEGIINFTE